MSDSLIPIEKEVYYWSEPGVLDGRDWILFTAIHQEGLLMCDLGTSSEAAEKYLKELGKLVAKFLPGHTIIQDREKNFQSIVQIKEYLEGHRQQFTLKLHPLGTVFQQKVWQALLNIPYGETNSYSEIAQKVGCAKGQRAIGMANNKNPLGIVVPCHRVIGKNGDLTGYAGGLEIKTMLLELEKRGKSTIHHD